MEKFIIIGGNRLNGTVTVGAAKNAVLPLMSCCLLCGDKVTIKDCPNISDVRAMTEILQEMGAKIKTTGRDIRIDCSGADLHAISAEQAKSMRSSVFMIGALIGRFKRAEVAYPGGCEIGKRPIDIHIAGLRALGVEVTETENSVVCNAENIKAGNVRLSFPSVGATENLIMSAALTLGTTTIENAAREPEIEDLAHFINAMGGSVSGAGTQTIVVHGVRALHGCTFRPIGDRIAAGTFLTMCATCGGDVTVNGCPASAMRSTIEVLKASGAHIMEDFESVRIISSGEVKPVPIVRTGPYPSFPTDMQPQISAMLAFALGTSLVEETIFERRFGYVSQLEAMGADMTTDGQRLLITGKNTLNAGIMFARDLRGGAALLTAALRADGVSTVYGTEYIDRGYDAIEETLTQIGADIVRVGQGE